MSSTIDPRRQRELVRLLEKMGLDQTKLERGNSQGFDWLLIDRALVHPSFSTSYNNDQLEFVGDSVLRLSVSLFLQERYGDRSVGDLAALRSHLVSDKTLAEIASIYELQKYVVVSNAAKNDSQALRSLLADALEALMAALFINTQDLAFIRNWLDPHMHRFAEALLAIPALGNYKVALQELTQGRWKRLPEYRNVPSPEQNNSSNNPPNNQNNIFHVEVWFDDRCWGTGQGKSIKAAQQEAAAIALQQMSQDQ
ncbi:ribonuclease III family protein [Pseudanabaena sp. FACHB-1998]|uniref:ribonuclease III family protein n=1 Tax=Pseudanabaena sp. FACHB-1998 TaxID=2692858 RepID=UPI001680391B|nr:ribonuclease III domain-containing protein [Pseudanabaena sp. FACHB-1998]MBD2177416.1 ribonuclease III family protein [Pseudanabaena sp. FACHB-1998]